MQAQALLGRQLDLLMTLVCALVLKKRTRTMRARVCVFVVSGIQKTIHLSLFVCIDILGEYSLLLKMA